MSAANDLTNKIITFFLRQPHAFAWRASSTGIYDQKRKIYRTAPKTGVADVLACFQGILIAVEVKIGTDRLSPEQKGFLLSVQYAGGYAFAAKTYEDFLQQIDPIVEKISKNDKIPMSSV